MRHHPRPDPTGPGEESVWAYPRPPALEPVSKRIEVRFNGTVIADSTGAYRVLERLDHAGDQGTVQGRPGDDRLVSPRSEPTRQTGAL